MSEDQKAEEPADPKSQPGYKGLLEGRMLEAFAVQMHLIRVRLLQAHGAIERVPNLPTKNALRHVLALIQQDLSAMTMSLGGAEACAMAEELHKNVAEKLIVLPQEGVN